jgi:hypothetical protein
MYSLSENTPPLIKYYHQINPRYGTGTIEVNICDRFSINKAISPMVIELFNMYFNTETNANLSPSQSAATLVAATQHIIK